MKKIHYLVASLLIVFSLNFTTQTQASATGANATTYVAKTMVVKANKKSRKSGNGNFSLKNLLSIFNKKVNCPAYH